MRASITPPGPDGDENVLIVLPVDQIKSRSIVIIKRVCTCFTRA